MIHYFTLTNFRIRLIAIHQVASRAHAHVLHGIVGIVHGSYGFGNGTGSYKGSIVLNEHDIGSLDIAIFEGVTQMARTVWTRGQGLIKGSIVLNYDDCHKEFGYRNC